MCWHIVETKNGCVALDGELAAHGYYMAHKAAGLYATRPRPADSGDLVDVVAVKAAEERITMRRADREYMHRLGIYNS
jgi:hypothetical protein